MSARKPKMTPEAARRDHWQMLGFMALNALIGIGAAVALFLALLWFDTGGLATRIANAQDPWKPVLLILMPLAGLFGAAAVGTSIMMLPYERKFEEERDE
jgi:Zn-dependent protease with chaperone function